MAPDLRMFLRAEAWHPTCACFCEQKHGTRHSWGPVKNHPGAVVPAGVGWILRGSSRGGPTYFFAFAFFAFALFAFAFFAFFAALLGLPWVMAAWAAARRAMGTR